MPTQAETLALLQPLFREILDIPDLVLFPEMAAKDVEEWDSLNHIRIISGVEQKFKISLTGQEVEKLKCVGDLAALLAQKLPA